MTFPDSPLPNLAPLRASSSRVPATVYLQVHGGNGHSHLQASTHRIHGAGIYANMTVVYIDGIHVTIYSSSMDPMGYGKVY